MQNVTEFFTVSSMFALGGASVGSLAVTNTLKRVLGWNPIVVCFVISLVICFVGAHHVGKLSQLSEYMVTFVNSCLLFCTTSGMQEFGGAAATGRPVGAATQHGRASTSWMSSWFR